MDDVSCSGNENSLDQCSYRSVSNCGHNEDVIITCSSAYNHTTSGNYRLANPKNMTNSTGAYKGVWGRAEHFNGTKWNQICDDFFSLNNARVLCRSLGLPVRDVRYSNAQLIS